MSYNADIKCPRVFRTLLFLNLQHKYQIFKLHRNKLTHQNNPKKFAETSASDWKPHSHKDCFSIKGKQTSSCFTQPSKWLCVRGTCALAAHFRTVASYCACSNWISLWNPPYLWAQRLNAWQLQNLKLWLFTSQQASCTATVWKAQLHRTVHLELLRGAEGDGLLGMCTRLTTSHFLSHCCSIIPSGDQEDLKGLTQYLAVQSSTEMY